MSDLTPDAAGQAAGRVAVIGLGKLGAPMAACFAARGHCVVGVDFDNDKIAALRAGRAPSHEPGLAAILKRAAGRLSFSTDTAAACREAELIFVIVPTPSTGEGSFALDALRTACREIGRGIATHPGRPIIVITSTVMPGATSAELQPILEQTSHKRSGVDFGLCYSPEFIALGSVVHDLLHPDFYLIGESDRSSGERLGEFYKTVCENDAPLCRMNFINAEIAKLSVNSYVTMKITFANTLARICHALPGADVDRVTAAIGHDRRIGARYLRGGLGYGGPCFPRDNRAFALFASRAGISETYALVTDRLNLDQNRLIVDEIRGRLPVGSRVGIIGISYKPDTVVTEESPALKIAHALAAEGYRIVAFDPLSDGMIDSAVREAVQLVEQVEACFESDGVVIADSSRQAGALLELVQRATQEGKLVIDCWRAFAEHREELGAGYRAIGRST